MDYDPRFQKNEEEKKKDMIRNRLNILFLVIFLIFSLVIIRLSYVQIVRGDEYSQEALASSTKEIPIPALRGEIYDRDGELLVTNKVSFTVTFTEENWMKGEYIIGTAKRLAAILDMPAEEVLERMDAGIDLQGNWVPRKEPSYYEKIIKYGLNNREIAMISERKEDFRGIQVVAYPLRESVNHHERPVAPQTIGYVRKYSVAVNTLEKYQLAEDYLPNQLVGMDGIEYSFERYLRGQNGKRTLEVDSSGTVLQEKSVEYPRQGNHVYLTIDSDIQQEVAAFVDQYLAEKRKDPKWNYLYNAYVVAMEAKTGKVVAMVSYPEYNPNVWQQGISAKDYQEIQYMINNGTIRWSSHFPGHEGPEASSQYPSSIVQPGSVVKPLTVLMGLNEGMITPNDEWTDPGRYYYGRSNDHVDNYNGYNFGVLTPQKAIQKSSNTYMARIGEMMVNRLSNPVEVFRRYHHAFGMGIRTGIQLPNESAGTEDYVKNSSEVSTLFAMVQASFGQQEHYTALQLATYAMTLANEGKRLRPLIVDKVVSPDGEVVETFEPEVLSEFEIPQRYWDVAQEGMKMVTQQGGTAYYPFRDFPYEVAAKTGTSEKDIYVTNEEGDVERREFENSTFISYAPADDPQLVVAVVIPGGGIASELARGVYDIYEKHIGLAPKTKK